MVTFVTGTDTDVGKTIVTAALAARSAAAGQDVRVLKVAQTGVGPADAGDADVVRRLADVACTEGARLAEPLAPATAARVQGVAAPDLDDAVERVLALDGEVALIEGAGGILVRLGEGWDLLDLAERVSAHLPVSFVVVARAGLGTLNHTMLTVRAITDRNLHVEGVVIGSMPAEPDLAVRENVADLPALTGVPLLASIPAGAGEMEPAEFQRSTPEWFITSVR